jgi:hypothetical protein
LGKIIKSKVSFICDASVDREWSEFKNMLIKNGYQYFIISLDLSKELLTKLYIAKKYFESLERIDELINDHDVFLKNNLNDIGLHLSDDNFKNRCQISYDKIVKWMKK